MTTQNAVNNSLSGKTGSGNFVGSVSATITTPVISQINDSNGNTELTTTVTASAVNNVDIANAATGNNPTVSAKGSDTNIVLTLNGKGNAGGILQSTQTNTNAPAGYMREYVSSTVAAGSAVSLSYATAKTITSISLTAGDWDVTGAVAFILNGTTSIIAFDSGISLVNNTLPTMSDTESMGFYFAAANVPLASPFVLDMAPCRQLLSTTTTIYLIAGAAFSVSTMTAYGWISARRC